MIWYHYTLTHVLIITRINQSHNFIQTYNENTTIKHKIPTQPNCLTNSSTVKLQKNMGVVRIPLPTSANHYTVLPWCTRLTLSDQNFTTQVDFCCCTFWLSPSNANIVYQKLVQVCLVLSGGAGHSVYDKAYSG